MKLAVHQPNYLPYLGFFDKARQVDVFVLLDDVQFTTRGYTNRNRIKSPSGSKWLTVPVKRQQDQSIKDVRIDEGKKWQRIHLNTLKHMYGKAPHYQELEDLLQSVYSTDWKFLAKLNTVLIKKVFDFLDINPEIKISSELNIRVNEPTTR
ncbi:MAG: WbqC family protein, partial [Candidatus Heimdallarchaeota archaeon]